MLGCGCGFLDRLSNFHDWRNTIIFFLQAYADVNMVLFWKFWISSFLSGGERREKNTVFLHILANPTVCSTYFYLIPGADKRCGMWCVYEMFEKYNVWHVRQLFFAVQSNYNHAGDTGWSAEAVK